MATPQSINGSFDHVLNFTTQNLIVFRDIYLQCHTLIDAAYEIMLPE